MNQAEVERIENGLSCDYGHDYEEELEDIDEDPENLEDDYREDEYFEDEEEEGDFEDDEYYD